MQPRRTYPPADIQYILDGAIECAEITALTYDTLFLYGDLNVMDGIINAPRTTGRGYVRGRGAMCLELDRYARSIVMELSPDIQRGMVACGVIRAITAIRDLAECLAWWNYNDSCWGDDLVWRRYSRHDANYNATPRAARELASPARIKRYVKGNDQSVPIMRSLNETIRLLPWPKHQTESRVIHDLMDNMRETNAQAVQDARAYFDRKMDLTQLIPEGKSRPYTVVPKEHRKRLIKSWAAAVALIGATQVSAFAHGAPILITGEHLTIALSKRGSLTQNSHGSMDVVVRSPEGVNLAALCVYFDKTPMLDQVAAFALHCAAGEEKMILHTGNLIHVTAEGAEHPLIKERAAVKAQYALDNPLPVLGAIPLFPSYHQAKHGAKNRYAARFLPLYREALEVQVWGRDVKRYRALIAA